MPHGHECVSPQVVQQSLCISNRHEDIQLHDLVWYEN